MSPLAIIAIVVFVTLFVILLLGSAGWVIWLLFRLHSEITSVETFIRRLLTDAEDSQVRHREKLLEILTGFSALTDQYGKELSTTLASHSSDIQLTLNSLKQILESHQAAIHAQISKINGEELSKAANQSAQSARRIEIAGALIGDLARALLSEDSLRNSGLTRDVDEDGFAQPLPDGTPYAQAGRVAAADAIEILAEAADNSTHS